LLKHATNHTQSRWQQAKKMNVRKNTLWILLIFIVFSCQIFNKSENLIIKEYYNPKQSMKVVVFEKTGNATVNNSIQASIQGYEYELNNEDIGNIFVADQFESFKISKDSILTINWINNETVEFIFPQKIRTFKKESQFENKIGKVKILYPATEKIDLSKIPDSLKLIADKSLTGDFNGDNKMDFASIVTNKNNQKTGVLIIHNSVNQESFVFGAGNEIDNMTDLDWIEIFKIIPKGEIVAPELVDEETGDLLGRDESQNFKLIGNGIYMSVTETHGGGIIFWNGIKYKWYHIE
jgi:hypothetical protein